MSNTTKGLILVTGVSGYLGAHIVATLLQHGYSVRGAVRPGKVASFQAAPISTKNPGTFEVVGIEDVCTSDFSDALKGVSAVVHAASPMGYSGTAEQLVREAKGGATNILEQALKAGVTKVVQTGTWGATAPVEEMMVKGFSDYVFTDKDYGVVDEAEFASNEGNIAFTYTATKALTEKTAWEFSEAHRELDFTILLPPWIYGPMQPDFPKPANMVASLMHIYGLISGEKGRSLGFQMPPQCVDVREVALAHVRALDLPPRKERKRYLLWGGQVMVLKKAVEYLAAKRPELKERLPSLEGTQDLAVLAKLDASPAEKDLGMKEYISWEQTLEDSVDSLLAWETK